MDAKRGFAWSVLELAVRQGAAFLVPAYLAHHLGPEVFGAFAVGSLVVAVGMVLADGGLAQSLIRTVGVTAREAGTILLAQAGVGIALAALIYAAAPLATAGATLLFLQGLCPVILFSSVGSVPTALRLKRMDVGVVALTGCGASLAGMSAVAVFVARGDYTSALMAQPLVTSASYALLMTALCWREIDWKVDGRALRSHWQFGRFVLWSGLLDAACQRLYAVAFAARLELSHAGQYERATSLKNVMTMLWSSTLGRLALPRLASVVDDVDLRRAVMLRWLQRAMYVNVAAHLVVGLHAAAIVQAVFGSGWETAGTVLAMLACGTLIWPMHILNLKLLLAAGASAEHLRIDVKTKAFQVASLLCALPFGIVAVAAAEALTSYVAFAIYSGKNSTKFAIPVTAQLRALGVPVTVGVLAIATSEGLASVSTTAEPLSEWLEMGAVVAVFVLAIPMTRRWHEGEERHATP